MKGTFFFKIGFVFILASLFTFSLNNSEEFITAFNNDYLLSRIVIDNVENIYEDFNKELANYKEDMTEFYGSLDYYYDEFDSKNKEMINHLDIVESDIVKLEKTSLKLYENCKYDIEDENTFKMCSIYKENFEGIISSYEKLVEDYNEVLGTYNSYVEAYGNYDKKVSSYESKMSERILKIYDEIK